MSTPAPVLSPVNWPTVRAALHAWIVSATGLDAGRVIWSWPGMPRPPLPYVALTNLTGGASRTSEFERRTIPQIMQDRIDVLAAQAGAYAITIDGVEVAAYPATGSDTTATIAAQLFGRLALPAGLTATLAGSSIQLDGTEARPTWNAAASGPASDTIERITVCEAIRSEVFARGEFTLRARFIVRAGRSASEAGESFSRALELCDAADAALGFAQYRADLAAAGLRPERLLAKIDASQVIGTEPEAVSVLDYRFSTYMAAASGAPWIDTLGVSGDLVAC